MAENKGKKRWLGIGLGALTSLPISALSFLGSQVAGLPFIPFNLFDFFTRVLPRLMVLVGIDRLLQGSQQVTTPNMGAINQILQPLIAVLLIALVGGLFGLILVNSGLKHGSSKLLVIYGLMGGAVLSIVFSLINQYLGFPQAGIWPTILFISALMLLWGSGLGWSISKSVFPKESANKTDVNRRRFLVLAG